MATKTASKQTTGTTERATELMADIATEVEALRTSEGWMEWLRFASQFHNYSLGNQFLIALQHPGATHVTGYGRKDGSTGWLKLGRQVRKGERGIAILRPRMRWVTKTDEVTGEDTRRKIVAGFAVCTVFDISQTDGDEPPVSPSQMWRDALDLAPESERGEAIYATLSGAAEKLGLRIVAEEIDLTDTKPLGWWVPGTTDVHVREASPSAKAATLVHEMTHALDPECPGISAADELVAESSAYIVSTLLGLEVKAPTTVYLAGHGGAAALKVIAERALKLANKIIEATGIETTEQEDDE